LEQQERISVYVGQNISSSQQVSNSIPSEKYPIHLRLLFSKSNVHLVDEIKSLTNGISKDKCRLRKTINKYAGISIDIYCSEVDALRPIVNGLRDKDLVIDKVMGEDEKVTSFKLLESAKQITQFQRSSSR